MKKVLVDAKALAQVLQAFEGPLHALNELRTVPATDNPVATLREDLQRETEVEGRARQLYDLSVEGWTNKEAIRTWDELNPQLVEDWKARARKAIAKGLELTGKADAPNPTPAG